MTVVRSGADVAAFLRRMHEGLEQVPTLAQAQGVRAAVAAAPGARIPARVLDRCGLDEGTRAAVIFQQLMARHPDEVGSKLRVSSSLSEVFAALTEVPVAVVPQVASDDVEVTELVGAFVAELSERAPRWNPDGFEPIGSSVLRLRSTDRATGTVRVAESYADDDKEHTMHFILRDGAWSTRWGGDVTEATKPLADLDASSLAHLVHLLEPLSAEATHIDALLAVYRGELEAAEGELVPALLAAARRALADQEAASKAATEALDEIVRAHLGAFCDARVGEAGQQSVNDAAAASLALTDAPSIDEDDDT